MVLNKQLITYIFIIIFIIITSIHLYKININNDNKKELFQDFTEEQNLGGEQVYINTMEQVKFGVKPYIRNLGSYMNDKVSKEELITTKTELNSTIQTNLTNIRTELTKTTSDLTNGLSDKATKKELNDAMPELSIIAYSGSNAPTGWQVCNGLNLFYKTGEPVSENQTRFDGMTRTTASIVKTPDLSGRFILGSGDGNGLTKRPLNQIDGAETHTLSIGEIPKHSHYYDDIYFSEANGPSRNLGWYGSGDSDHDNGPHFTGRYTYENGGGGAHNNMPPFYVLTYIIKQPSKL